MTSIEKAKDIYNKMYMAMPSDPLQKGNDDRSAKQCALICVNEIIDAIDWHGYEFPNIELDKWEKVKQEIEKL
jgi:hypothetical protein